MANKKGLLEQQRAVHQVLVQLFEVLLCAGATEEEVRSCALASIKAAKLDISTSERMGSGADDQDFGSVLRTWHRENLYLSENGFPKPLYFEGKKGLRVLIGRYFPKTQIKSRFAALRDAGLIKQDKQKRWIPTGKYALFPHLDGALLGHLSEGVSRLIETVTRNVTAKSKEDVLFERSAKVRKFPISAAQEFREFVKSQAIAFLATVDDWMEAQEERAKRKRVRKCTAGVFTFAFMDQLNNSGNGLRQRQLLSPSSATHPSTPAAKSSRRLSSANHS